MFLMGGEIFDQSPQGDHLGKTDALWKLEFTPPSAVTWTFLAGSPHTVNAPVGTIAQYGVQDQFAAGVFPTARHGHTMILDPLGASLWMFGGDAQRADGLGLAYQADLWSVARSRTASLV